MFLTKRILTDKKTRKVYWHQDDNSIEMTKTVWDTVYMDKELEQKRGGARHAGEPTEKHWMYYQAFQKLDFFDGLNLCKRPIILQAGLGHGKTLRAVLQSVTGCCAIGLDICFRPLQKARSTGLRQISGIL